MITKTWKEAATLILAVKSSINAYKILLLQRSSASKFMVNIINQIFYWCAASNYISLNYCKNIIVCFQYCIAINKNTSI